MITYEKVVAEIEDAQTHFANANPAAALENLQNALTLARLNYSRYLPCMSNIFDEICNPQPMKPKTIHWAEIGGQRLIVMLHIAVVRAELYAILRKDIEAALLSRARLLALVLSKRQSSPTLEIELQQIRREMTHALN